MNLSYTQKRLGLGLTRRSKQTRAAEARPVLTADERAGIIRAHLAGDNARLISVDQYFDYSEVQQIIEKYEADEAAIREAWARIDEENTTREPQSIQDKVIEMYISTDKTARQIAKELGLLPVEVQAIIKKYNES